MTDDIKKYLGEFISKESKFFGDVEKYIVVYKQPNGTDPTKEWNHQAVVDNLSNEAVLKIDGLSAGERFCVHLGKDGKYPIIVDVTDAKDAPAPYTAGKAQYKKNDWKPKDETGVAVGAAYKDVKENMDLLEAKPKFKTLDEVRAFVKDEARKILKDKQELEDEVRAKKAKDAPAEAKAEPEKKLSRAERIKAEMAAAEAEKQKATPKPAPAKVGEEVDDTPFTPDELDEVKFDD